MQLDYEGEVGESADPEFVKVDEITEDCVRTKTARIQRTGK